MNKVVVAGGGVLGTQIGLLLKEKIDKGETGINAGKGFYEYKK